MEVYIWRCVDGGVWVQWSVQGGGGGRKISNVVTRNRRMQPAHSTLGTSEFRMVYV